MRKSLGYWILAAALGSVAGCGSSTKCGNGTKDMNGTCVPDTSSTCGPGTKADSTGACVPDGSVVCTDGTVFDMSSGTCVIDPNSCQGGTVLINGACVDPTQGLTVDLEEGAEPNGAGLIESSQTPAGTITLKPIGGPGFVIHGKIAPFQDSDGDGQMDPDVDTYVVTVTAPTLLHVTADGVNGIDAGFVSVAVVDQNNPLASWARFGMNITGDTSKRQIYLPAAGTYALGIADTRTLFQFSTGGPVNAAPGPGDYYITIDQVAIPTPTALTVTSGTATQMGTVAADADVQFFTNTMGTGFNDVQLSSSSSQIVPSVVVSNNGAFRNVGTASTDPQTGAPVPAEVLAGGFQATDTPVIAVDNEYNTGIDPVDYTLTVTTNDATALSTNGGTATATEISSAPQSILDFNEFYYDVSSADESTGMKISWNHPVDGLVVDQDLFILAPFTYDPNSGFTGTTFASYNGILRHPAPGRYYFIVYDPAGTAGTTNLTATSTYGALTTTAITEGTATASTPVGTYNSNPFSYARGADPWQQFAETTSNAGNVTLSFYDPTTTYGRLGSLTVTPPGGTATALPGDALPFTMSTLASNGTPTGRIVIDDAPTTYYITASAANATKTNTFALTFSKKNYVDFGTINTGDAAVTKANNMLAAGGTVDFFVQTDNAANLLKFVGTPTGATPPNIALHQLNADESVALTVSSALGGAQTMVVPSEAGKWVAVSVTGATPLTSGTFDLSSVVTAEGTYTQSNPGTTFTTICNAGTTVTMHADSTIFGSPNDEGLSDPMAVPAGFTFFGASVGQIQISTNGWASFQTNQTQAQFTNADMPDAGVPNAVIAPYWTDLANVQVCALTTGGTMTIEWRGTTFSTGASVAMQAKLNGTNGRITFVYDSAANMTDDGSDATVGVEDFGGANASKVEYNTAGSITAGSSTLFTPM